MSGCTSRMYLGLLWNFCLFDIFFWVLLLSLRLHIIYEIGISYLTYLQILFSLFRLYFQYKSEGRYVNLKFFKILGV